MVATRAAVDRCGPGHVVAPLLTRIEEGQGLGGGERAELHGDDPDDSSSPAGALRGPAISSRHVALVDFLGALDDEEFFVVEGSGWQVAGSLDPQVTR